MRNLYFLVMFCSSLCFANHHDLDVIPMTKASNIKLRQFGLKVFTYLDCVDLLKSIQTELQDYTDDELERRRINSNLVDDFIAPPKKLEVGLTDLPAQLETIPYLRILPGVGMAWILKKASKGELLSWMKTAGISQLIFEPSRGVSETERKEIHKLADYDKVELFRKGQMVVIPVKGGAAFTKLGIGDDSDYTPVIIDDQKELMSEIDSNFEDLSLISHYLGLIDNDWYDILVSMKNMMPPSFYVMHAIAFLRVLSGDAYFPYSSESPFQAMKVLAEKLKNSKALRRANAAMKYCMKNNLLVVPTGNKATPGVLPKVDVENALGKTMFGINIPHPSTYDLSQSIDYHGETLPWYFVQAILYMEKRGFQFNGRNWVK